MLIMKPLTDKETKFNKKYSQYEIKPHKGIHICEKADPNLANTMKALGYDSSFELIREAMVKGTLRVMNHPPKTEWQLVCEKRGTHPDRLHAQLRVAIIQEDKTKIRRLVEVVGIPIDSFNSLAIVICKYYGKDDIEAYLKTL